MDESIKPVDPIPMLQPVQSSSNVAAWGYDIPSRCLYVEFKGGSTYRYNDVPGDVALAWAEAESKGKFFLKEIKPKFLDFTKLPPKEEDPPPALRVATCEAPAPRVPSVEKTPWPFPSSSPEANLKAPS